ncbi:MAG: GNAT family N-acetyltransferase [Dehalogenimonas sp.]|uniref:GNAT family N-acetyltransferase n=1 Tax=Candidatus Dehalogenimonas loeffleri TaxID=3127115 RepID=A0ABZ2J2A8_9CHLR|nr:GNAT family N-acetyltransferase [Dehalogenimonas sp.]
MNKNQPFIRRAGADDIPIIAGYNLALALETENRHLNRDTVTDGVTYFMGHPNFGFYIIAEIDGRPAAQTMITYEWSDWRNGVIWWIQSVYVAPEYRRRGLYRSLYQYIKTAAQADGGVPEIRLYVDQHNKPAQRTYQALGMQRSHYLLYEAEILG